VDHPVTPTTVFEFHLPRGYVAADGVVHAEGVMRLATAADELSAARDPRVLENAAYLPVALLSRVVTKLGTIEPVTADVIERLFASDLASLQRLYDQLNHSEAAPVYRSVKVVVLNSMDENLLVQGFAAVTGSWNGSLKPRQDLVIPAQSAAEWMSISAEAGCGSHAFVRLASSHGYTELRWNLPWIGEFEVQIEAPPRIKCTSIIEQSRPDKIAMVITVKGARE
jgi:hypothetical protein